MPFFWFNFIARKFGRLWVIELAMNSSMSLNVEKIKHGFPNIAKLNNASGMDEVSKAGCSDRPLPKALVCACGIDSSVGAPLPGSAQQATLRRHALRNSLQKIWQARYGQNASKKWMQVVTTQRLYLRY
jgi:hypothetical protein